MNTRSILTLGTVLALCAAPFGGCGNSHASHEQQYAVRLLVSDGVALAEHTDANLLNAWGLARSATGPWWVANNHTSTSTVYDQDGVNQGLVVDVPGAPTGMVAYEGSGFVVSDGTNTGPARFLFASEDGTISAWSPGVPPPSPSTTARVVVDSSPADAIYKGLALTQERLYAADFHNGRVDVFDNLFQPVSLPGAFVAPSVSAGYAPFGIQAIGNQVFVAYALQDVDQEDEVAGPGTGFVEVFDLDGNFVEEVAAHGPLNAPWGMALAPAGFGAHAGHLLVGNFGDGRINAYERVLGRWSFAGALLSTDGSPIAVDGLWGIAFGNGGAAGPTSTLYFAAGPADETQGLFGRIDTAP